MTEFSVCNPIVKRGLVNKIYRLHIIKRIFEKKILNAAKESYHVVSTSYWNIELLKVFYVEPKYFEYVTSPNKNKYHYIWILRTPNQLFRLSCDHNNEYM